MVRGVRPLGGRWLVKVMAMADRASTKAAAVLSDGLTIGIRMTVLEI